MLPYFTEYYGNPSSVYELAGISKKAVTEGREKVASVIGANPNDIYFTAGGSESDNWALKATYEAYKSKGNHIITTKIEHHAILHTCEWLEKQGAKITYLDVDENGVVDLDQLQKTITPETILISVMAANNEIGTLQPIKEIGAIAKEHGILFHTDAVQAFGQIPINVDECNIDMLSSSGHKINGPKGIGCLYIRKGLKLRSFVHGGAQERKRRAGTENVPGIVGYGVAAERALRTMEERTAKEIEVRDYMIKKIQEEIPYCKLNGHPTLRLPNNVNFSFQFIEGESLLIMLDMAGICASSGSACTSGSLDPSHLQAKTGSDKTNEIIQTAWKKWCKKQNCDVTGTQSFTQMMRMCVKRKKVDGGILIIKRYTKDGYLPFKLQTFEVDELDNSQMLPKKKGNKVVGGIEMNEYNKPMGYWIRQYSVDGMALSNPVYVDAKDVIFLYTKHRPSQVREMSDMSPTITRIRDANEFMIAVSVKERIAACLSVFIKKQLPTTGIGRQNGRKQGVL